MKPFPGESMKSFERRVDTHMRKRKADLRAAEPVKRVSPGRKEKMKERARARKAKKRGAATTGDAGDGDERADDEADTALAGKKRPRNSGSIETDAVAAIKAKSDEFPKDHVAFGDRAMQPPTLTVIPRAKASGARHDGCTSGMGLPVSPRSSVQHTREEAARRMAIARPAQVETTSDNKDEGSEDAEAVRARREDLRRAHFAQYKAQVLTAYAEMKKRRVGGGVTSGALVAPPVHLGVARM